VAEVYAKNGIVTKVRSRPEIERFFVLLHLIEPGVQSLPRWRPSHGDSQQSLPADETGSCYGGLARKP
jgi:hypothetical protein